jgi:enoyl-CoA hydratase/carnithine racemase
MPCAIAKIDAGERGDRMSAYADYQHLSVSVADKVATVVLNRPEARNAINQRLIHELRTIWDDLADDKSVNAVLLTGEGRYFSVGGDVKAMSTRPGGDVLEEGEVHDPMISRRLVTRLLELDKPIVCAINGDTIGLAATIALLCDITVASRTARIGDTHVSRVGLVAGDGGTVIWPLLIGVAKAKEFLMRGTLLTGAEAERIGLVNHAVAAEEVLPLARAIAAELAAGPTWAIRWTKLSINQIVKERVNHLLEASMALEQVTFETADHREATRSFAEKRKPVFSGG